MRDHHQIVLVKQFGIYTHFIYARISSCYFSTKSLTAIALAWLYDQGLLDYDAKIAEYWPQVRFHMMSISVLMLTYYICCPMHMYDIYARSLRMVIFLLTISTLMPIVSADNDFQFGQNGKEDITVADLMRHEVILIQIIL